MPTIILSSTITNRTITNLINGSAYSYPGINLTNYGTTTSVMNIMKGTIPTDFSTLTLSSSRSTDNLVSFNINGKASVANANTLRIDTGSNYVYPSQSGIASWFWIFVTNDYNADIGGPFQMIGTISTTGGGGDMQFDNTNIQTSYAFKISNFLISVDYTHTF
jgi:hypothetical protein